MSEPYTIRIFVPDGDPGSVRLIDRMNWAGMGIAFPRAKWGSTKHRDEFKKNGIYILRGPGEDDNSLPTIYVGQGEEVGRRIDSHFHNKDFWDQGIVFVSTSSGGLNRAHITWLEYKLLALANDAGQCILDNGNLPREPKLSDSEKADIQAFLREILQILPLMNFRAFERPRPIETPVTTGDHGISPEQGTEQIDTIVVPARLDSKGYAKPFIEGFESVFLNENCWYAIRISPGKLPLIKYIAAYQVSPVSAITHYAPVGHIEPYGEDGKYKVVFSEPAKEIGPIPRGDGRAVQSPRYANFEKLREATSLTDLFDGS